MGTVNIFDLNVQRRELKLAEAYQPTHDGLLPNDPFWRHVERRFDIAVDSGHLARFEHYHSKRLVDMLKENMEELRRVLSHPPAGSISMIPSPPCPLSVPVEFPVVTSTPIVAVPLPTTSQDQSVTAEPLPVLATVPEPSGLILGGLGLGAAILFSWWRKS